MAYRLSTCVLYFACIFLHFSQVHTENNTVQLVKDLTTNAMKLVGMSTMAYGNTAQSYGNATQSYKTVPPSIYKILESLENVLSKTKNYTNEAKVAITKVPGLLKNLTFKNVESENGEEDFDSGVNDGDETSDADGERRVSTASQDNLPENAAQKEDDGSENQLKSEEENGLKKGNHNENGQKVAGDANSTSSGNKTSDIFATSASKTQLEKTPAPKTVSENARYRAASIPSNQESPSIENVAGKETGTEVRQSLLRDRSRSNVTLSLEVDGQTFEVPMDVVAPSRVMPEAKITIKNSRSWKRYKMSNVMDLKIYEGQVKGEKDSYAVGTIQHGVFGGIINLPDRTSMFIEPKRRSRDSSETRNFVFYRGTDVEHQRCPDSNERNTSCHDTTQEHSYFCRREDDKIVCYQGARANGTTPYPTPSADANVILRSHQRQRMDTPHNASCTLKLISDPSHFVHRHNKSVHHTLRELLVATLQANHALGSADLDGDGHPDHLHMRLMDIDLYGELPSLHERGKVMSERVDLMQQEAPEYCATLMVLSENLPEEPVSVTYGGGVCGDRSENVETLPENVAVINTFQSNGEGHFLSTLSRLTTQTLGQMMGSLESDCDEKDDHAMFFSNCQQGNIASILASRGFCLESKHGVEHRSLSGLGTKKQVCGDGVVQEPQEECDCGSLMKCSRKEHCCIPPGEQNECKVDRSKGYECDKRLLCCTDSCMLVQESAKFFCGVDGGHPNCTSRQAYCNGKFAHCPVEDKVAKHFDGRNCDGPDGQGICKDGLCNQTACQDNGQGKCELHLSESTENKASTHLNSGMYLFNLIACVLWVHKFSK